MIRVAKFHSEFGKIEIIKAKNTGAVVYLQGGYFQSETDSSGVSIAPYIHAIFGFLAQAGAADVLMIGCGGGSLATMLHKVGARVTIVDINPTAFHIAREYFNLPQSIECHVADGLDFLHVARHRYDAIVVDAYMGGDIAHHLCTETFFELAQARLNEADGCLISNVCVDNDCTAFPREITANLSKVWTDVRVLDTPGLWDRNTLLLAGKVKNLTAPELLMAPMHGSGNLARELERFRFVRWQIPRINLIPS